MKLCPEISLSCRQKNLLADKVIKPVVVSIRIRTCSRTVTQFCGIRAETRIHKVNPIRTLQVVITVG